MAAMKYGLATACEAYFTFAGLGATSAGATGASLSASTGKVTLVMLFSSIV
jgi:hypothetical protein